MMGRLGVLGLAVLGAGCAGTGLTPFPSEVGTGPRKSLGLDPFPAPHRATTKSMGLSAFPEVDSSKPRKPLGLDPFPAPKGGKAAPAAAAAKAPEAAPPAAKPAEKPAAKPVEKPAENPVQKPAEPPAAAPRIAFKFEKGSSTRYRSTVDSTMKAVAFGQAGMKFKVGMDLRQDVRDVRADGAGVVAAVFEAVVFEMANPALGVIRMDTRDAESVKKARDGFPMLADQINVLAGLVGKSLELTMDPSGKVVAMGSVEELFGEEGAAMAGDMQNQMTGVPSPFPETPVFEGLSWPLHQEQANGLVGKMVTDGTMIVKTWDAGAGLATIGIDGKVSITAPEDPDEDDPMAQMAAMIKFKDSKFTGTMVFDVRRGRLSSSHTVMCMALEHPMMGGDVTMEAVADLALIP